jgi:23S rRNA G2445 N2-methylase RlmL
MMEETPPLYAHVHAGLESVAAEEIERDLGAEVKKSLRGSVVFRAAVDPKLLKLRTVEDLFLLAWGSNSLSYRATDQKFIQQSTAKVKWDKLFKLHQQVRPLKGKPTYHIVCQMQGEHGYRRVDAKDAFVAGLQSKIPANWQLVDEDAWIEFWLTIVGKTATCGLRLTDRTQRHRTYKQDHIAASLRPSVAAAMVRLAGIAPGMTVLDSFCGAGTILAEHLILAGQRRYPPAINLGTDTDPHALYCAGENLKKLGQHMLLRADARALPFASESVDRIVSNPPFGKQLSSIEEIGPLYNLAVREWDRVLKPGGKAVVLVSEIEALREAISPRKWLPQRHLKVRILGQAAVLGVWQKPQL